MTSRTTTALASKAPSASKKAKGTRFALAFATALTPVWVLADNLPSGGTVVGGAATISTPNANTMTINQGSDRAIVNWDGFSIGAGNTVNINQPSADAAILNRVTGDTTSQIHGSINANGRVFVVNPNGIFIGKTGTVNSGGFVASTLDIRNDDFITGKIVFEGNGSSATVENAGNIQVVTGGYAALIGGKVKNSGTIQAPLGFVGLGSGERITLDLAGNGFLQVAIPTDSGDDGLDALIENSGTIQANGGTVQISAATARHAARHAINMSGVIEARTVSGRNGRVTLGGGSGGKVVVTGKVRTSARRPAIQVTQSARPALRPERGGDITVTGRDIDIQGATFDASGTDGGGTIRIGGNQAGGPGLPTANTLTVDEGTTILADAILRGDGGRVILWSDLDTKYSGHISAQGGEQSGDGGFAEVSGKITLSYDGTVDLRAENGAWGELLLDPNDIDIVAVVTGGNQLAAGDIENTLNTVGSVVIDTDSTFGTSGPDDGNITVDAPISWTSGNRLTLLANRGITVNEPITSTSGALTLQADTQILLFGDISTQTGAITLDSDTTALNNTINVADGSLSITGGSAVIGSNPGGLDGIITSNSGNIRIDTTGGITMLSTGAINATSGDITLEADAQIQVQTITGVNGNLDISGGSFFSPSLFSVGLDATGGISGTSGNVTISAGGPVDLLGPISVPNGNLALSVIGSAPTISAGLSTSTINVDQFELVQGNWEQNTAALPAFFADNFVLTDGSFLRVLGGDGMGTPYQLTDVYGLQGVGSVNGGMSNFEFASNIDARETLGWRSLDPAVNGARDAGLVPLSFGGVLDGMGFDVSGMFIQRHSQTAGDPAAGMFSRLDGTVRNMTITGATVDGPQTGIVTALNSGTIDGVSVSGVLRVNGTPGQTSYGGGIAGLNDDGTITQSGSSVAILDRIDPSALAMLGAEDMFMGGIVGANIGIGVIDQTKSGGSASFSFPLVGRVGGIAGANSATISNSYVTGSVAANTNNGTSGHAGGIVGQNTGTIINTLANGAVSLVGGNISGGVGGLVGTDDPSPLSITSSYFNTETTGQMLSGQNGEIDAGGLGSFQGARAETTASLRATQDFYDSANDAGWDFMTIWALPQDGVDQARLYPIDLAISAFGESPDPTFQYTSLTTGHSVNGTIIGGLGTYRFEQNGTGDATDLNDDITISNANVGPVTYTFPTTFTTDQGLPFSVRQLTNNGTVTTAPLTVTVGTATKAYGTTLGFGSVPFTATTLLGTDTITDGVVSSAGAPATADVAGGPYALSVSGLTGTGLTNYAITFAPGTLTVLPATLNVALNNASKAYGDTLAFTGTEFTATGLLNSDTVTSLAITSNGAAPSAQVADGPFAINGSNPVGTGLANYAVNITPGTLTIVPGTLTVTIDDLSKTYGDEVLFDGDEFTATGLRNDDTVSSLTITSEGAGVEASVSDAPFSITGTNPVGSGADNYTLNIIPGELVITPAPLTITADAQEKQFGTEFTFTGTEFTVDGLLNGDAVANVSFASDGALSTADLTGEAGAAILITDPSGTGLGNYQITLVGGVFIVAPGNVTITANDQTKVYGETFVFNGTEFTVAGLAPGDNVDSVTLSSGGAGPNAQVAGSTFDITPRDALGSGLEKYTLVYAPGSFEVTAAPLTIQALDQTKEQGQLFTFNGTEFATNGLLNADAVTTAVLSSDGAPAEALIINSPFDILVGDVAGTGLSNYIITRATGSLSINNQVVTPIVNPIATGTSSIPNPPDSISFGFDVGFDSGVSVGLDIAGGITELAGVQSEGTRGFSVPEATEALEVVDTISDGLEAQANTCGSADQDFANYMSCLSRSLDTYSNALDQIVNDLPDGLETVSATIRTASEEIRAANARAQRRLASATSNGERRAIRREAVAQAQGAINTAKAEIRKAIGLIRADDPEVAAVQRNTGARIVQAFDAVESSLVRAVEL